VSGFAHPAQRHGVVPPSSLKFPPASAGWTSGGVGARTACVPSGWLAHSATRTMACVRDPEYWQARPWSAVPGQRGKTDLSFQVENAAEAYAAIALLVVGADGIGTIEERDFLFGDLREADVFAGYTAESLGALLGRLVGRMQLGPDADDTKAVTAVCSGARGVLRPDGCRALFSIAVRVAHSDGLDDRERRVLGMIAEGLDVDVAWATALIEAGVA